MASSLFGNQPKNQPNNIINMIQQFGEFKKQMSGQDPQAIVQNLISTGKMSQDQFNQLAEMAKGLEGILK